MDLRNAARLALAAAAGAEVAAAVDRWESRRRMYGAAKALAAHLQRRLVVVGAPDNGAHTSLVRAYGCGDVCVDLDGCAGCPTSVAMDLTTGRVVGVEDDSAVVFVSCVLEYVSDPAAAWRELVRMAGSPANVFVVTVQPWTATAALYPGGRLDPPLER